MLDLQLKMLDLQLEEEKKNRLENVTAGNETTNALLKDLIVCLKKNMTKDAADITIEKVIHLANDYFERLKKVDDNAWFNGFIFGRTNGLSLGESLADYLERTDD